MLKNHLSKIYSNLKEDLDIIKKDMSEFMVLKQNEDLKDSLPEYNEKGILSYNKFKEKADSVIKNIQEKRSSSQRRTQKLNKIKKRLEKIETMLPHYEASLKKEIQTSLKSNLKDFLDIANEYRVSNPQKQKIPLFQIKEKPNNILHDLDKDLIIEHIPRSDYIKDIEQASEVFKQKEPKLEIIQKIKPKKIKSISFTNNEIKEFNNLAKKTYSRIKREELKYALQDYNALNLIYLNLLNKVDDSTKLNLFSIIHDIYDKLKILKLRKIVKQSFIKKR